MLCLSSMAITSKHSIATLDTNQKRHYTRPDLTSLAHQRKVPHFLCFIYIYMLLIRIYSDEKKSLTPQKACSHFADIEHLFMAKLKNCRTSSFAITFILMTTRYWNCLSISSFPAPTILIKTFYD